MNVTDLSVSQLDILFREAAETERRLPAAIRKQKMSAWPEFAQGWSAYGYTTTVFPAARMRATPQQISRYDLALELSVTKMNEDDRRIVWAVAHSAAYRDRGPQWKKIAHITGHRDPRIIKRRYQDALLALYYRI